MSLHILDLPLDITENIMMLGCETNALDWFYPGIYDGCNDLDEVFPFFEVLEHPCIRVMSEVCSQWEASVTSSVEQCRWSRFKRIELHVEADSEDPDLAGHINEFVRALQLSSSSAYGIPLYVFLQYPDPVDVEESSIRLFIHGVGKLLLHAEHIHSLEISLDQAEFAASHVFWLLFALSQRRGKFSFINMYRGNYTTSPQMSALLKATIQWSLGPHRHQSILSAASKLRRRGNNSSIPRIHDHDPNRDDQEATDITFMSPSICGATANCLQSLGNIKRMQDDNEEARGMLEEANIEFESLGNRRGVADCLWSLGDVKRMQYDYEGARGIFERAKVEYESLEDCGGVANCLCSLGDIKRMQNDYEGARGILEKAKGEYESLGDHRGVANCLWSLGDIKCMQDDYEGARGILEKAKGEYESLGDHRGVAGCLRSLGNIKRMQDDYEGAGGLFEKAKVEFESLSYRRGIASCLRSLGDIKRMQNDYERAIEMLEKAKTE